MIDRKVFYDHVRASPFGGSLSQSQVNGMNTILDTWETRGTSSDLRWLAYMLATTYHETARTMQPIAEIGGESKSYAPYYGRGFVQVTWLANYEKLKKATGVDVVTYPDRAMEVSVAVMALFDGMEQGWYTGKKLSDYIHDASCDYVNARQIVNGLDRAQDIAGYAKSFQAALDAATMASVPTPPAAPAPTTTPPPVAAPAQPPGTPPMAPNHQDPGFTPAPPTQGSTAMGGFIAMVLPMIEQYVLSNLPNIEQTLLNQIEAFAESLFTKVNKANPATPDKTVVAAPPKA